MADCRIYTGVNRTGKTARVVKYIADKFYYEKDGFYYPHKPDLRLVSNIDSLNFPHVSLDDELKDYKPGQKHLYFTKENQELLFEKYGEIMYIIDEAQFIFPKKLSCEGVDNWLQWFSHIGQTIFLITQDQRLLPPNFLYHCSLITNAVPQAKRLHKNWFRYRLLMSDGKTCEHTEDVFIPQKYFDLYKSQILDAGEKPPSLLGKKLLMSLVKAGILLCLGGGLLLWKFLPSGWFSTADASVSPPVPPPPPPPPVPSGKSVPVFNQNKGDFSLSQLPTQSLERKKISYYIEDRNGISIIKFLYRGVWTAKNFPYEYEFVGSDCFAFVPSELSNGNIVGNLASSIITPPLPLVTPVANNSSGPLLITIGG